MTQLTRREGWRRLQSLGAEQGRSGGAPGIGRLKKRPDPDESGLKGAKCVLYAVVRVQMVGVPAANP